MTDEEAIVRMFQVLTSEFDSGEKRRMRSKLIDFLDEECYKIRESKFNARLKEIEKKCEEEKKLIKERHQKELDSELRFREQNIFDAFFKECVVKDSAGVIYYRDVPKRWVEWCEHLRFPQYHINFYKRRTPLCAYLQAKLGHQIAGTDPDTILWVGYRLLVEEEANP